MAGGRHDSLRRALKRDPIGFCRIGASAAPRELDVTVSEFHVVRRIVHAQRVSLAILHGDLETLRQYAPLIEHDAD